MKKILALVLAAFLLLALSACTLEINPGGISVPGSSADGATQLTKDQALAIALQKAGVQKEQLRDLDIELDLERGIPVWEVDFEAGITEYSYDVDAYSGEIVKREKELDGK